MKPLATFIILVALTACLHAQTKSGYKLDRYLVSPYGMSTTNTSYTVSSSVGDVAVDFFKAGNFSTLNQGFQQALIKPERIGNSELFIAYRPNPVTTTLRLQFKTEANYTIEVFTITGSKVKRVELLNKKYGDISFSALTKGLYIVKVSSSDKQLVASFKISKM